jgi:uncharacterized radical SAM superfamily protein
MVDNYSLTPDTCGVLIMADIPNKKIFYTFHPGKNFPSISITGDKCILNCAHCAGHYLKHMLKAESKDNLFRLCRKLNNNGAEGVLISGGCDQNGHVMFDQYFDVFKDIKLSTNLILNVHTGLMSQTQAHGLVNSGIDVASVDVVGDSYTIKNVYGLNHSPEDYQKTILALKDAGLKKIVPHICVGLDYGKVKGEFNAIDLISNINPGILVLIILIPTKGTRMGSCEPPPIKKVIDVIEYANLKIDNVKLFLGCMRPKTAKLRDYNKKLEIGAINAGISGIVLPSKYAISYLNKLNFSIKTYNTCCAVV